MLKGLLLSDVADGAGAWLESWTGPNESPDDSWPAWIEGGRGLQLQIHRAETKRRHQRGREEVKEKQCRAESLGECPGDRGVER